MVACAAVLVGALWWLYDAVTSGQRGVDGVRVEVSEIRATQKAMEKTVDKLDGKIDHLLEEKFKKSKQ